MGAINYKKYSNMSKKQLLNSLKAAKKKEKKLKREVKQKLSNMRELIEFLSNEVEGDNPKYEFIPHDKTGLKRINDRIKSELSPQEQEKLKQEVLDEINKSYSNEL